MDSFMDKIAQKLSAQEVIRANSAADAAQMERLEKQVAEYDACMKEMRRLNLKNAENEQKLNILIEKCSQQMEESLHKYSKQLRTMAEDNSQQIRKLTEEAVLKIQGTESEAQRDGEVKEQIEKKIENQIESQTEELRSTLSGNMEKLLELFNNADEFVHKENVKVYRNVQAAVVEELEKQTQSLLSGREELLAGRNAEERRNKKALIVNIITLAAAAVNIALLAVHFAGIL